jgi:transposase-like protein
MSKYQKYSDEFKKKAIQSTGKAKSTIEKELGITHGLLGRWQKRFQMNEETDKLELSEVEQLKAEVRRLELEAEILRQECDILEKTVSIFSKDPK